MKRTFLTLVAWSLVLFALCAPFAACYDRPTCSFRCGPEGRCPTEYACASDGWCKLKGTSDDHQCAGEIPDAAPQADSEPE